MNLKLFLLSYKLAIQGDGKEWKLKQEMLSGKFTTQWNDIIKIKC